MIGEARIRFIGNDDIPHEPLDLGRDLPRIIQI
jgi:hypothetical protein